MRRKETKKESLRNRTRERGREKRLRAQIFWPEAKKEHKTEIMKYM